MEGEQKIITVLVLYFIILTFLFFTANQVIASLGLNSDGPFSSSGGATSIQFGVGEAGSPRFEDINRIIDSLDRNLQYDITPAPFIRAGVIYDENTCTDFEGFSWVTKKSFWFFGEASETCEGFLNLTYYNDGDPFITDFKHSGRFITRSVCELSGLQNQQTAELFGCTWYEDNTFNSISSVRSVSTFRNIWNTLAQVFTFRISFNSEYTVLNGLLAFIFVWMPLSILVFSVIMYLRKIVGFT